MVQIPEKTITLEEFLKQPETKPASEYINGQIIQKPVHQRKHSTLQIELASAINQAGKAKKLAYVFTELRCTFAGCSIVPDIAIFEWQRIPLDDNGQIVDRFEIAPDWIVEILSPEQWTNRVIRKIVFCLKNGTKLSYIIDAYAGGCVGIWEQSLCVESRSQSTSEISFIKRGNYVFLCDRGICASNLPAFYRGNTIMLISLAVSVYWL